MIDVNTEHVVTLSELARRLPRRLGRPVHLGTIHRWRGQGVRGVRLDCARIGGIWHTSLEAYQRWVDLLSSAGPNGSARPSQHLRDPKGNHEEVDRQLRDIGM